LIDLEVQIDQAPLDRLNLGKQTIDVRPGRQVEEPEEHLHVPVDPTLGLENPLPAPRERLGDARIREHSPGKPRKPLPAEAVYPLQDGLALRTPVPALAL